MSVRNIRRDVNDHIKAMEKNKECSEDEATNGHEEIQKMTDKQIKNIDQLYAQKEADIMEV